MGRHAQLAQLRIVDSDAGRTLDMSRVGWLDPMHLVFVAVCAYRAIVDGVLLNVVGVADDVAGYAARMRLNTVLDTYGARHELPQVREHDRHESLHEVRAIASGADVASLAELVYNHVETLDAAAARALHTSLAELGDNVTAHSRAEVGFVAAQTLATSGRLRFAVADGGVGMLATLSAVGATDAHTAIQMALSGTTSTNEPARGRGLPATLAAVSELEGRLLLLSGAAVTVANQQGRAHSTVATAFSGTLVEGYIPVTHARHRAAAGTPRLTASTEQT